MSLFRGAKSFKFSARAAFFLGRYLCFSPLTSLSSSGPPEPKAELPPRDLIVVGAPGGVECGTNFARQATLWQKACQQAQCSATTSGLTDAAPTNDYEILKQSLDAEPKESAAALWLVLIGHGTFDGKEARFNLRGPDISATDLAGWLKPFHRPMAIIDTSSSSAPFLN